MLTEGNDAQIYLQEKGRAVDQCVQKLKALTLICEKRRDSLVTEATERAMQICKT